MLTALNGLLYDDVLLRNSSLTHSLAATVTVTVTLFSCYLSFHVIWCSNQGQRLLKIIDNGSIRKPGYGFLFALHSNHGFILYRFRDKGIYWPLPLLHSTPPLGGSRSKYCHTIWYRKTGWWRQFDDMFSRVYRMTACDEWTDRHFVRAMRSIAQ